MNYRKKKKRPPGSADQSDADLDWVNSIINANWSRGEDRVSIYHIELNYKLWIEINGSRKEDRVLLKVSITLN